MKNRNKLPAVLLVFTLLFFTADMYAGWVVKSGNVRIVSGSSVRVSGDVVIHSGAAMNNSGTLVLDGDFTNNGAASLGSGTVEITGTATRQISGTATSEFGTLTLSAETSLDAGIVVHTTLELNGAGVELNNYDLTLALTASLTGYDATNHVVTEGSGSLFREVGSAETFFPVGCAGHYLPAGLINSGVADMIGVRVFDDVLDGGLSGSAITEINNAVSATWAITEQTAGGSDIGLTVYWNVANEGSLFNRNYCGIGHYHSGAWNGQPAGQASGTDPYSLTREDIISFGAFAVGDLLTPLAIGLRLDVTAFLEGPFDGPAMATGLNAGGVIPLTQPYSAVPWNYSGTESVASIPNSDIVDWVLVDLRDAASANLATGGTMISRQAAFLKNDGTIVGLNGASDLLFHASVTQNLYVVVLHRNHLAVMSASALAQSGGLYAYDFSTGSEQACGGNNGHKEIAAGIWGMAGGDGNADRQINNGDKNDVWAPQAGTAGYKSGDFNMDVGVNNGDKNDVLIYNVGRGSQVPE